MSIETLPMTTYRFASILYFSYIRNNKIKHTMRKGKTVKKPKRPRPMKPKM